MTGTLRERMIKGSAAVAGLITAVFIPALILSPDVSAVNPVANSFRIAFTSYVSFNGVAGFPAGTILYDNPGNPATTSIPSTPNREIRALQGVYLSFSGFTPTGRYASTTGTSRVRMQYHGTTASGCSVSVSPLVPIISTLGAVGGSSQGSVTIRSEFSGAPNYDCSFLLNYTLSIDFGPNWSSATGFTVNTNCQRGNSSVLNCYYDPSKPNDTTAYSPLAMSPWGIINNSFNATISASDFPLSFSSDPNVAILNDIANIQRETNRQLSDSVHQQQEQSRQEQERWQSDKDEEAEREDSLNQDSQGIGVDANSTPNPFEFFFGTNDCVDIPVIGGWIGLKGNDLHVCTPYNDAVKSIISVVTTIFLVCLLIMLYNKRLARGD